MFHFSRHARKLFKSKPDIVTYKASMVIKIIVRVVSNHMLKSQTPRVDSKCSKQKQEAAENK